MDDSSFIRVHRLQGDTAAAADHVARQALGQRLECLFTLLAEVAAVDGDAHVVPIQAVDGKAGQVLDGVDGLAAAADDKAEVVALQGDVQVLPFQAWGSAEGLRAHRPEDGGDIFHRHLCLVLFDKDTNLCRVGL